MVISGMAVSAGAQASDGALRLTCFAPSWIDDARLDRLCHALADGMAEAMTREVQVVTDGADVALEVVKLDDSRALVRLHWPDAPPGPDVTLGSVDAPLTDQALRAMAVGLLSASPPP